jgi:hypothetical protein
MQATPLSSSEEPASALKIDVCSLTRSLGSSALLVDWANCTHELTWHL